MQRGVLLSTLFHLFIVIGFIRPILDNFEFFVGESLTYNTTLFLPVEYKKLETSDLAAVFLLTFYSCVCL